MSTPPRRPFEVGPGDEMARRFGWTAQNWRGAELDDSLVPEALRDLIPLATRFGVSCDVTRHDVGRTTSDAELAALKTALHGRHEAIWDFLYAVLPDGRGTEEQHVFQALLVFELEECRGPGIPGAVKYWSGKCARQPTEAHLTSLRAALESDRAFYARIGGGLSPYVEAQHAEAERLLASAET